jgi:hypothetical protein
MTNHKLICATYSVVTYYGGTFGALPGYCLLADIER